MTTIELITAEEERVLARASERVLRTLMEGVRTRRRDAAALSEVVEALARARGVEAADYGCLMGRAARAAATATAADAHEGVISSMLAIIEADLRRLDRRIEMMSDTVDDDVTRGDAVSPTWIVEGAGSDDAWTAEDAEDAASQAARAQWGDDATVTWVGTGPAHAHSEWEVRWTAWVGGEHVVERARVVVSRPRPTLDEARVTRREVTP